MWYRLVRGAKFLGVAPWELGQQPLTWLLAAEEAQAAEAAVRKAAEARKTGRSTATRRGASRTR